MNKITAKILKLLSSRLVCANAKALVACTSLAALSMTPLWLSLLTGPAFHHALPSKIDWISGLVLLALVTILIVLVFKMSRSANVFKRPIIGSCLLFCFLFFPLDRLRSNIEHLLYNQINLGFSFKLSPIALIIILILLSKRFYLKYWRLILIASPFSAFVVVHLFFKLITGGSLEPLGFDRQGPTNSPPIINRVVWIIFDELDYRLAFIERPRDLKLKNFDHLANESVNLSFALPPAQMTSISIPSLIDGRTYIASYPSSKSDLILRLEDSSLSIWGSWENIFTHMQENNRRSAAVGWFMPYTRIFKDKLDYSQWEPNSPERYIGKSDALFPTMWNHLQAFNMMSKREFHKQTVESCIQNALQVAADEKYSLCFIHLPIPHLPSIQQWKYNEPQGDAVNYFRNLAAADQALGYLLDKLTASSVLCKTTVIVSSDHHWRKSRQYDGKTDPRVPFIIRFPNQSNRIDIKKKFNTVKTRFLVQDIIKEPRTMDLPSGERIVGKYISD
jgi:hypothetical protein